MRRPLFWASDPQAIRHNYICRPRPRRRSRPVRQFVGETPWVHMDIAGTAWGPKEPSYQPKVGATGVAVRLVYQFLENRI